MDPYLDQLPQREQRISGISLDLKFVTRSPREAFCEEALYRVNREREGTKYKPVTARQIALMINVCCPKGREDWLHDLRKSCNEGKSYGKVLFWSYKLSRRK